MIAIYGMEMRRIMVAEMHSDLYPEEPAYRRHSLTSFALHSDLAIRNPTA
jgi:hypothetical protein